MLRREDVLTVDSIQQEKMPVAVGLRDELSRAAVDHAVNQHRRLRGVPIMRVVRRHLVVPHDLPGIGIEGDDRAGIEIVPFAILAGQHGLRIAGADVVEVELRVVGAGEPRHAAAVGHHFGIRPGVGARLPGPRRRVPAPDDVAALRIARLEIAGHVERVAADAKQHLPADDDGRARRKVLALDVGDLVMPALFSRRRVERDEVVVRREEVQPVAEHADTAIADVDAAARLPEVVPVLAAGARVDRPHVIGRREVEDAVEHQRRRLDRRRTESVGGGRRHVGPLAADICERLRRIQPINPGELQTLPGLVPGQRLVPVSTSFLRFRHVRGGSRVFVSLTRT